MGRSEFTVAIFQPYTIGNGKVRCYFNERNELTKRTVAGDTASITLYHYDNNGSIISEEQNGRKSEYRYDLLNRQTYVRTLEGKEQENSYDGEEMRAGLTEDGKRRIFLYYNGEILTECDGESAPVRRYLNGIGLSHVQTLEDGMYHAYHQDEQGSTAYITEEGRQVQNSYWYDAFGNLLESKEDIENRILYTGQQYDQVTGQYYLRARYYNPVVGRFLQEDSYRGDGLNLYAYCANNPVMYYDPSGHVRQDYNETQQQGEVTPAGEVSNEGGSQTVWSRLKNKFSKNKDIAVNKISYNPTDDVFKRGFNSDSVSYQRTYYAKYGRFDCSQEPIVVYDVGNGNYMMQGGHHRLKAANDLGLETIRVNEIIPFEESVRLGIVDLPLGMIPNEF